jgi:hypothetical protein
VQLVQLEQPGAYSSNHRFLTLTSARTYYTTTGSEFISVLSSGFVERFTVSKGENKTFF